MFFSFKVDVVFIVWIYIMFGWKEIKKKKKKRI